MAKQRERTGFEPPTVEEQAVPAKGLRCCDQVGEDELPVCIKYNRELVGQPVERHLTIQKPAAAMS